MISTWRAVEALLTSITKLWGISRRNWPGCAEQQKQTTAAGKTRWLQCRTVKFEHTACARVESGWFTRKRAHQPLDAAPASQIGKDPASKSVPLFPYATGVSQRCGHCHAQPHGRVQRLLCLLRFSVVKRPTTRGLDEPTMALACLALLAFVQNKRSSEF